TVAAHLKILGVAFRRCLGVDLIERVGHAHAFDRLLFDAVNLIGCLDAGYFENSWHDINDMVELTADSTDILNVAGPGNSQALAGPAKMRSHLFGPLKRSIKCQRPAYRHVWVGLVRTPVFIMQHL